MLVTAAKLNKTDSLRCFDFTFCDNLNKPNHKELVYRFKRTEAHRIPFNKCSEGCVESEVTWRNRSAREMSFS